VCVCVCVVRMCRFYVFLCFFCFLFFFVCGQRIHATGGRVPMTLTGACTPQPPFFLSFLL